MHLEADVKCMHTNFGGCGLPSFGDIAMFKYMTKLPFLTMDYSPWSWKNLTDRNRLKKFMQVGVDVKCMHTNFGGVTPSLSEIWLHFKNGQISLSGHGRSMIMEKFNRSESAQKIYASRD